MRPDHPDRAITSIAAEQHGVFHRSQATGAGLTPKMIRSRVERGLWERLAPSVFSLAGAPDTFPQRLLAATLSLTGSAAFGRSALAMHQVGDLEADPIEIAVATGSSNHSPLARVRERTDYRTTRVERIPVATVDQAIADLAGCVPYRCLAAVADDALVAHRVHLSRLEDQLVLASALQRRGVGDLRRYVASRADLPATPESELERALVAVLSSPGIPYFELQAALPWNPSGPARVDALIPSWRLVVEADGRRWHTRERDFERDRARDQQALAHGWATLRLTFADLTIDRAATVRLLLRIGRERSLLLGSPITNAAN